MRAGAEPAVDILPLQDGVWGEGGVWPGISRGRWILDRVPVWAAATSFVVGGAALFGWAFNLPALTHILPQFSSMKAVTAACFMVLGVALFGASSQRLVTSGRILTLVGALVVAAVAVVTLFAYATGAPLFLDTLLWHESTPTPGSPFPGRMSPNTAGAFLLVSISLIVRHHTTPRALVWSNATAALAVFIALVSCVGYAYRAYELTTLASQN